MGRRLGRPILSLAWVPWLVSILLQCALSAVFYGPPASLTLRILGWVVGLLVFGLNVLSIATLRAKGRPTKGQSYTATTALVDSGIYAIARHPQYLGFMLLSLFLALVVQHWLVVAIGCVAIALVHKGIVPEADRGNIETYGEAYRRYMAEVPAVNIPLGIVRYLQRRASRGREGPG